MKVRIEKDSMGIIEVPLLAKWGAQTQRALLNFPISGWPMPEVFIRVLGLIKYCAAQANKDLELIDSSIADAILIISKEIYKGFHFNEFPIDVFQTGSATSSNMNANEVISHLVKERLNLTAHPNDHVNMSQSSNDTIPAVIAIATVLDGVKTLLPALDHLQKAIDRRADELKKVTKTGRTHLMDALPLTFGQELSGWSAQLGTVKHAIQNAIELCKDLPIGGTAIGTGLNAHPSFAEHFIECLNAETNLTFKKGENFFELMSAQDRIVSFSGQLKMLACCLMKIANDLRWMNSGPLAGFSEIALPSLQPGSSIMPGKVNPVIPESCAMVCAHVIGSDLTVTMAGQSGNFQLNVMLPLIAYHVLENMRLLSNTCINLADKAIDGFVVHYEQVEAAFAKNPILVTALNRKIGYELGAVIAKEALEQERSVLDVALEKTALTKEELIEILDPYHLTKGGLN
ncbi:class II fumarate hydratase [bacterium]|jgi:fumarate hydratase class II|nr:class II fumarate hydratase [bacterium]NBW57566.1 class II fumarate hydratase [bacterium]NBX71732.1 class II fumarate hydratase [bacterium]